tara:strand:+ start:338 stop:775 length:438 start_codon:yes stop_codon:yes gene_type:complete
MKITKRQLRRIIREATEAWMSTPRVDQHRKTGPSHHEPIAPITVNTTVTRFMAWISGDGNWEDAERINLPDEMWVEGARQGDSQQLLYDLQDGWSRDHKITVRCHPVEDDPKYAGWYLCEFEAGFFDRMPMKATYIFRTPEPFEG